MRTILFRGKRIDNGEWIEGGFHKHLNRTICALGDSEKPEDIDYLVLKSGFSDWNMPKPLQAYAVDPATVGQFTGQTDKNDKRIFEGDILKLADEELQVIYNEFYGCFELMYKGGDSEPFNDTSNSPDECEVIGNIHETQPESEK